jgi:hypothetical protein
MAKQIREQIRDNTEIVDGERELLFQDYSFQEDNEGQTFDPVEGLSDEDDVAIKEPTVHNNNILQTP